MVVDPLIAQTLRTLPKVPGIYMFKDGQGDVIYIGKAKNLYNRVRSYFNPRALRQDGRPKVLAMVRWIRRIDVIEVASEAEALILEGRLLKEYKPKYNTSFVDDKRFLLVRVDAQTLPRFHLCRNRIDPQSIYYGPFVHGPAMRKLYYELRRRFGVLLSEAAPRQLEGDTWRLYEDARAEIFEHTNDTTREEYLLRVGRACAFLDGHSRQWREELADKMQAAAAAQQYEQAAKWRDLLESIERSRNPANRFLRDPMMKLLDHSRSLEALQQALEMASPPSAIECFDISHISGSFAVASLVRFTGGKPDKARYKRFRIKSFVGNDDFRAMHEVVGRHYRRLVAEGRGMPDLIVIDGGAGQLSAALAAFAQEGITPPLMIGLAKREETFVFADGRPPLTLPRDHDGLRLLQRVRDEAHRVANSYNADLRSRQLKISIIDDCPGLGPKRRQAIFERFQTIERLRAATLEEISQIPGIGDKQGRIVFDYLHAHDNKDLDKNPSVG
jgi:excinuclease ABC subunit C